MHCHTFFSYNAYGYSPSGLAWLGKKEGYKLMGIVDFDVLDGVDEWLEVCELVGLRGSAGMETRAFVPEFADSVINSPGEPGVTYHMGIGFTSGAIPDSVAHIADDLRERAQQRNLGMLQRVNAYLDPVTIDYQQDVLPLTPAGNATERHMVVAFVKAAQRLTDDPAAFWANKLDAPQADITELMGESGDGPGLQNLIRKKLMKRGGVGYVQPGPDAFPTIEEFHQLITACGALPCAAWLDGTTAGEQRMEELLALLIDKGVVTLNIVPDRNWNIADPVERKQKVENLHRVVELAQKLDLPINVGTEMNSFGNKLVDDFDAPELAPVRQAFLDGAYFIYGHTVLQRVLGLGYQSHWAKSHLPTRAERNAFYTRAGRLIPPGKRGTDQLLALPPDISPTEILNRLNR
ncbi:MAG TPA: hypothetical protein G4N94_09275, partial [Caldilineae bacterium]|nr:hypothetical protein [Caldilineae bacterium]